MIVLIKLTNGKFSGVLFLYRYMIKNNYKINDTLYNIRSKVARKKILIVFINSRSPYNKNKNNIIIISDLRDPYSYIGNHKIH